MAEESRDVLGVGWAFPVRADADGRIRLSRHEDHIVESIYLILSTARGERVMRPDFGAGIHDLLFEPVNQATAALVEHYVRDALVRWEPRIEVRNVKVTTGPAAGDFQALSGLKALPGREPVSGGLPAASDREATLLVHIEYRVWESDTIFNLVYPFYLERGAS